MPRCTTWARASLVTYLLAEAVVARVSLPRQYHIREKKISGSATASQLSAF